MLLFFTLQSLWKCPLTVIIKMFRLVADLELGRLLGNFLICFLCYLYEDCAVLVICFNDSEFIDRLEVRYL